MEKVRITARLLLIIFFTGFLTLPVWAEESQSKTDSQKPESVQEDNKSQSQTQTEPKKSESDQKDIKPQAQTGPKKGKSNEEDDIWKEVTFESAEDLQITEKQVAQVLQGLKKSDPKKAEQIEKLKDSDAEAFFKAIREEIEKQKDASKKPEPEKKPPAKWKELLQKKHENFLSWFEKQYPEDHKELTELKTSDPEKFAQRTMDLCKIYEPILRMERHNADLAAAMKKNLELQRKRDALLLQMRISSESEYEKLIVELKVIVSERFDTIVQEKQLQYEWLGRRLNHLTKRLETRAAELDTLKKSKDLSVDERLKELVERTETVNWK